MSRKSFMLLNDVELELTLGNKELALEIAEEGVRSANGDIEVEADFIALIKKIKNA